MLVRLLIYFHEGELQKSISMGLKLWEDVRLREGRDSLGVEMGVQLHLGQCYFAKRLYDKAL